MFEKLLQSVTGLQSALVGGKVSRFEKILVQRLVR